MYAKFINQNQIELAPQNKAGILNYNLDETLLKNDGYLPLEDMDLPDDNDEYRKLYKVENQKICAYFEKVEQSYAQKRLSEYPPLGDMFDAICKKMDGDSEDFERLQVIRREIKAKYPKDNPDE